MVGVLELGLSREQVSVDKFGQHTTYAIKEEMAKSEPLSAGAAFAKYRGLDSHQVVGVLELGLSRDQVLSKNFGFHTIDTIKAELAKPVTALDEVFVQHLCQESLEIKSVGVGVSDDE